MRQVLTIAATVLLVWLMRPGDPSVPGTGGLLSRQSRAVLLVLLVAAALAGAIWWVLNGRRRPRRVSPRIAVTVTSVVFVLGGVTAAVLWPGGLVRHWPKRAKQLESPVSTPVATTPRITSKPSTSGTTVKSSPTSKPGATTGTTKGK